MSDCSESSNGRDECSSVQSGREYASDLTTTYNVEQSDNQTVADTEINGGNPPSHPPTPSAPSSIGTMTNVENDDVRDMSVDSETHTSTNYGLEVIQSRDEPWSPRVSPRPSHQNLRPEEEQNTSEPDRNMEDDDDNNGSSEITGS